MAIYGLGEIECAKDIDDLLTFTFCPKLNYLALKWIIINHERAENGKLGSDGELSIYKKIMEGNEGDEGASTFHTIFLDRTDRLRSIDDMLFQMVPIRVFITGDLGL